MGSFDEIYTTYFSDVFRYARSLTQDEMSADELTQETFFRALRALPTFRGECELRVWLCRIAKNCFYSERKRQSRFADPTELESMPDGSDFTEALDDRDSALALHRQLHALPEPYREVFSLRVFGELSFREIGDLFGKNEHWACITYHRAKEKIVGNLKERTHPS